MINLHLLIGNPWAKENFANLGCKSGNITKNKAWECEILRYAPDFIDLQILFTTKADHAGFRMTIGIFGYSIHAQIYDVRHWNYETNDWVDYKEKEDGQL